MDTTFGIELKCLRLALGRTQDEVANLLEIPSRTLWDWENSKTVPAEITQEGALSRLDGAWDSLWNKRQAEGDFAFFENIGRMVKQAGGQ